MVGLERTASSLFSSAVFRPIVSGRSTERGDELVRHLRPELGLSKRAANLDVVHGAHAVLRSTYRSEYYYRNLLASKLFVGRHRASSQATLLNELAIDTSVADCVLLNGHGVVFEIKTQLDRPEKLLGQLASYYRAFPLVNVVVHEDDVDRYHEVVAEMAVGLWTVGNRYRLSVAKEPHPSTDSFEHRTLFNLLRAAEASSILTGWYGSLPTIPNGRRYREHLAMAEAIPVLQFQRLVQRELKQRTFRGDRSLLIDASLEPLRAVLVQLNPAVADRDNLMRWLSRRS
jgi:hypothetical protein